MENETIDYIICKYYVIDFTVKNYILQAPARYICQELHFADATLFLILMRIQKWSLCMSKTI